MKFKVGDRVRVRQWDDMVEEFGTVKWHLECINTPIFVFNNESPERMGRLCGSVVTIKSAGRSGYAIQHDGHNWVDEMLENYTIKEEYMFKVKVGDEVVDRDGGHRSKVLEVGQTTFLNSKVEEFNKVDFWITFERAEELGWKIKGQESDEVEVMCEGNKTMLSRQSAKTQGFLKS